MLEAVARSKKPALKRKHLRTFLDHVYTDREFFSALRLILPGLDKDRGTYGLKEAVLGKCLSDALGLAKQSEDAKKLFNWKKGGHGSNAGDFPLVAAEVLYRRQSTSSGNLTIKSVNEYLDRLALAESRDDKTVILAELINKTNAQEMKWILIFMLKDLKLGIGEKTVLHELHPDAEDLFNVTCDLKLVCEKLKDRNQRYKRQDIVVGKPGRPQLASRVAGVEEAWRKLRGKRIVAECKFDGDRIQIHKNGNDVHFYSRSFIDHKEYTEGLAAIILKQIQIERCILDGEMLVWNKLTNRFAEFGSNQEVAKAAKDGLKTDQQLCYVAFDILYSGDSSVTHQGLSERQLLLKQVVQPLKGSLELLLPGSGFGPQDQPRWSILVQSPEEINKFFLETVENRDEGIVLKDLDSKWEPGDRSGKWIKLKPDYVHAESDLDALIIGCYLGSGRRGGEIGQFLLGLAERPKQGGHPTRFLSFCKVGSGLSDNERDVLVSKLKPYLRRHDKNTKPPSFYTVTNSAKERPDFWVEQPEKSVILEITSDIRTIRSEVFATPYSLRFPRAHRVRYDKPWYDCLDVESLVQLVQSQSGNTADVKEYEKQSRTRVTKSKRAVQFMPLVPSHMLVTDVSQVKQETSIFKGLVFHFINVQPQAMRDALHKLVAENGGSFAININDSVTHAIAAEKKGIRYQAAALRRDIIHQSWVTDCCSQKTLLPLRPKYVLHLPKNSKIKLLEDMDECGDGYFQDLDVVDLRQLFQNLDGVDFPVHKEEVCQFQIKYCEKEGFGDFCGCCIYFHNPIHSSNLDSRMVAEITLKRLELELLMREGEVTSKLKDATHMIIYTSIEHPVSFNNIIRSVTNEDRNMLMYPKLHIVKHAWLEDALTSNKRPEEEGYSLRDTVIVSSKEDVLTPEKVFGKEQLPIAAGKLCKKRRSSMMEEGSASETDEITSKRQLYSAKDSKACSPISNVNEGTKQSNQRNATKRGKRKAAAQTGLSGQELKSSVIEKTQSKQRDASEKGKGKNHAAQTASTSEKPLLDPKDSEVMNMVRSSTNDMNLVVTDSKQGNAPKRRRGRSLTEKAGTSGDKSGAGGLLYSSHSLKATSDEAPSEKVLLSSENQGVSAMLTTDGTSENVEEVTAGKKKKVSYKDLVGNFFGS